MGSEPIEHARRGIAEGPARRLGWMAAAVALVSLAVLLPIGSNLPLSVYVAKWARI